MVAMVFEKIIDTISFYNKYCIEFLPIVERERESISFNWIFKY